VPGWRQKVYKYMHIYLWTALRIKVFCAGQAGQVLRLGLRPRSGQILGLTNNLQNLFDGLGDFGCLASSGSPPTRG